MRLHALHSRLTAWLALLALVLGTFAPAVAQSMLAGSERVGWVQICTASGMSWVQLDANDDGVPQSDQAANGCTWCTAQVVGGLPPQPTAWRAGDSAAPAPVPGFASAVLARSWAPAQSRAPPLL